MTLTPLLPYCSAGESAAGSWDSKAEWVRCMKLTHSFQMYLSTNQGCFYSLYPTVDRCSPTATAAATTTAAAISSNSNGSSGSQPAWRLLYSSPRKAAITCMQILPTDRQLLPHGSMNASATATPAAGGPKRDTNWAVLGDGVGVVTCLEVGGSAESQSNAAVASEHSQGIDFGLQQQSQQSSALVQDGALQGAHTPSSRDSALSAQASETQDSGVQSQAIFTGEDSSAAKCVSQQPEQHAPAKITSPLPRFSWVAHQGSPVLAIFHPSNCGPRHVFTTSIAGAPMKWWLLPEPAASSAATSQEAETQNLTQPQPATSSVAASQVAETQGMTQPDPVIFSPATNQVAETRNLTQPEHATSSAPAAGQGITAASSPHPHTSSTASGEQLSRGQTSPKLLAEVTPILGRGSQIVAADACWSRRLLVCGDMAGNVMAYSIPQCLLQQPPASGECDFLSMQGLLTANCTLKLRVRGRVRLN